MSPPPTHTNPHPRPQDQLLYVKPVQTGYPADSDSRFVARVCASAPGGKKRKLEGNEPRGSQDTPILHSLGSSSFKTLFAWSNPISPHLASRKERRRVSDAEVVAATAAELSAFAAAGGDGSGPARFAMVETAGGVASPGPSGSLQVGGRRCRRCRWRAEATAPRIPRAQLPTACPPPPPAPQCDILRAVRLPAVLVGDHRLGGISATISAYESLLLRGYDVEAVVLMSDEDLGNASAIRQHFRGEVGGAWGRGRGAGAEGLGWAGWAACRAGRRPGLAAWAAGASGQGRRPAPGGPLRCPAPCLPSSPAQAHRMGSEFTVVALPMCAPPSEQPSSGALDPQLRAWLHASSKPFAGLLQLLKLRHQQRLLQLQSAKARAKASFWWPFTQHSNLGDGAVTVVDSRCAAHSPPGAALRGWRLAVARGAGACGCVQARALDLARLWRRCGEDWHVYTGPSIASSSGSGSGSEDASSSSSASSSPSSSLEPMLQPQYDAPSSWWTQTAASQQLQAEVARSVAYAAGRYMHVMFPENAHEPALQVGFGGARAAASS
jgi:dethiobiotin synthetase